MVAKGYIGPYLISFVIAQFVLVMQFLWKYIDDITGKGISTLEILELIFYFSFTIIPKSIPITILLSSVFVFGNLAERFEITSMKSAGISLLRIMRMGMIFSLFTALFSIFASNYIVPKANYLFFEGFFAIKRQKPALTIEAGIFNQDFTGYNIYVGSKNKDGQTIKDIMIYDETNMESGFVNITTAKTGVMSSSSDGNFFIMNLQDGMQYRDIKPSSGAGTKKTNYPFLRTEFKSWQKAFDLSQFEMNEQSINLQGKKDNLLNTGQLLQAIDSVNNEIVIMDDQKFNAFNGLVDTSGLRNIPVEIEIKNEKKNVPSNLKYNKKVESNTLISLIDSIPDAHSLFELLPSDTKASIIQSLSSNTQRKYDSYVTQKFRIKDLERSKSLFNLRLHQQYSWAMICIIFLFVGAPLGAIIRKGGYGYPLLLAIVFFMLFIILMIMGEKLHRSETLTAPVAAWLPCIVILPMAIFLSYKALKDSKLFDIDSLMIRLEKFKWFFGR